jgi:hypothetical protein
MTTPVAQWRPADRLERGSGLLAVRRESSKLRPAIERLFYGKNRFHLVVKPTFLLKNSVQEPVF